MGLYLLLLIFLKMEKIIKSSYSSVSFDETDELKEKVYQRVLKYFIDERRFCGEGIMQSDDPVINAPLVFAEMADDLFRFKYLD